MNERSGLFLTALLLLNFQTGFAEVKTLDVDYTSADGAALQGVLAYDDASTAPKAGILIVHDWMGLRQFQKDKAMELAKQGYVAFAADIYGKGVRPENPAQAGKQAGKYKADRPLLQKRVRAAFDQLVQLANKTPQVNPAKIVVMGYCFGGTTALELARSGAPVAGTAVFHGGLSNPTPQNAANIHGPVLVMHGADDPSVPPAEVKAFKDEMKKANVKLTFVAYPGAVHAFTNPDAGNDNSKGAAYNANADHQSWIEFEEFIRRVLK